MLLHLINYKDPSRGGAQKVLSALVSAVPADVRCLADSKYGNKLMQLLHIYWQVFCLRHQLTSVVIHSRMYLPLIPLLKLAGVKTVYYLHAMYRSKPWLMTLFKADAYVAVSKSSKDYLIKRGIAPSRIEVIANPLLNTQHHAIEKCQSTESNVHVFSVGALEKWKGFDWAIKALGQWAKTDNIAINYTVIGAGSEQKILEMCAKNHQGDGLTVKFLGKLDDPFANVTNIGIQLIPSFEEGFGLVAIEGIYHGKSLIYRKIPALSECCENDDLSYGFDDPYQMVQMIKEAVQDRCLINDLSVYKQRKKLVELSYGYGKFKQRVEQILSKIQ